MFADLDKLRAVDRPAKRDEVQALINHANRAREGLADLTTAGKGSHCKATDTATDIEEMTVFSGKMRTNHLAGLCERLAAQFQGELDRAEECHAQSVEVSARLEEVTKDERVLREQYVHNRYDHACFFCNRTLLLVLLQVGGSAEFGRRNRSGQRGVGAG